jgi:hypothetical protein
LSLIDGDLITMEEEEFPEFPAVEMEEDEQQGAGGQEPEVGEQPPGDADPAHQADVEQPQPQQPPQFGSLAELVGRFRTLGYEGRLPTYVMWQPRFMNAWNNASMQLREAAATALQWPTAELWPAGALSAKMTRVGYDGPGPYFGSPQFPRFVDGWEAHAAALESLERQVTRFLAPCPYGAQPHAWDNALRTGRSMSRLFDEYNRAEQGPIPPAVCALVQLSMPRSELCMALTQLCTCCQLTLAWMT